MHSVSDCHTESLLDSEGTSGTPRRLAPDEQREVRVRIQSCADVIDARQQGRALAARARFANSDLTIIATAISEIARNIVQYADHGEVVIALIEGAAQTGIRIIATDEGPGIADVAAVMRDGSVSGKTAGIGLAGVSRLMDDFEVVSEVGKGTTVMMKKWPS